MRSMLKSKLINMNFLTWLAMGLQLNYDPIGSQFLALLLTNIEFHIVLLQLQATVFIESWHDMSFVSPFVIFIFFELEVDRCQRC